ncbi:hypothetical protein WHR41_01909 [Cladosporium halotolerans]|uniref:HAD-like protein n=1 Tax=Cladosporium halotolerans TaxID=1052096 RepID=A0AB34L0W5_9PEZI
MPYQLLRTTQLASRRAALTIRTPAIQPLIQTRLASKSTTNPTNTQPSSSTNEDAATINSSRATDSRSGSPDTASVQNPVSNPSQGGAAQSEEPQGSQENMRRDPREPDDVKRAHVEKEGQKPLDPADK